MMNIKRAKSIRDIVQGARTSRTTISRMFYNNLSVSLAAQMISVC